MSNREPGLWVVTEHAVRDGEEIQSDAFPAEHLVRAHQSGTALQKIVAGRFKAAAAKPNDVARLLQAGVKIIDATAEGGT